MAKPTRHTFTHTIVMDVVVAIERFEGDGTPTNRRDLVRSVFAAVEGLHWQLKQEVLKHPNLELSAHEQAAMSEESYAVDSRGQVSVVPRFLPLLSAIRLVVQMVKRYRPTYNVDFGHSGWGSLKKAIEIRNRIVHPKNIEDLSVSDKDVASTIAAFFWFLALVIEVLEENNAALKELRASTRKLVEELKLGKIADAEPAN